MAEHRYSVTVVTMFVFMAIVTCAQESGNQTPEELRRIAELNKQLLAQGKSLIFHYNDDQTHSNDPENVEDRKLLMKQLDDLDAVGAEFRRRKERTLEGAVGDAARKAHTTCERMVKRCEDPVGSRKKLDEVLAAYAKLRDDAKDIPLNKEARDVVAKADAIAANPYAKQQENIEEKAIERSMTDAEGEHCPLSDDFGAALYLVGVHALRKQVELDKQVVAQWQRRVVPLKLAVEAADQFEKRCWDEKKRQNELGQMVVEGQEERILLKIEKARTQESFAEAALNPVSSGLSHAESEARGRQSKLEHEDTQLRIKTKTIAAYQQVEAAIRKGQSLASGDDRKILSDFEQREVKGREYQILKRARRAPVIRGEIAWLRQEMPKVQAEVTKLLLVQNSNCTKWYQVRDRLVTMDPAAAATQALDKERQRTGHDFREAESRLRYVGGILREFESEIEDRQLQECGLLAELDLLLKLYPEYKDAVKAEMDKPVKQVVPSFSRYEDFLANEKMRESKKGVAVKDGPRQDDEKKGDVKKDGVKPDVADKNPSGTASAKRRITLKSGRVIETSIIVDLGEMYSVSVGPGKFESVSKAEIVEITSASGTPPAGTVGPEKEPATKVEPAAEGPRKEEPKGDTAKPSSTKILVLQSGVRVKATKVRDFGQHYFVTREDGKQEAIAKKDVIEVLDEP